MIRIIKWSIGVGIFECLFLRAFKSYIGYSIVEGAIMGIVCLVGLILLGVKYRSELIDPLFD